MSKSKDSDWGEVILELLRDIVEQREQQLEIATNAKMATNAICAAQVEVLRARLELAQESERRGKPSPEKE